MGFRWGLHLRASHDGRQAMSEGLQSSNQLRNTLWEKRPNFLKNPGQSPSLRT
jgi:hypothetical protein